MSSNKTLLVISVVAIVNALGYGIIIPLQYTYVSQFGVSAEGLGLLFAAFSLAQFISTPIIGRLSDRYGRKPLLLYSVLGTAVSFAMFALANSAPILFLARILDGISGGNISVAQAVISDSTGPKERAKWFGILGASFGFGFVFGPAIGGILSRVSVQAPYIFAAGISLVAAFLVQFLLKESVTGQNREKRELGRLFDLGALLKALFEPYVGLLLAGTFTITFAFAIFILGFQTFTNDVLRLSPTNIALLFTVFGAIGLVMQGFLVGKLVARFSEIPLLITGVIVSGASFFFMGFSREFLPFFLASIGLAVGNALIAPLISALLSKHTKKEDQGGIMGINQSYMSLSNIVGPVIGGLLAQRAVSLTFFGAGAVLILMFMLCLVIARESGKHVVDL